MNYKFKTKPYAHQLKALEMSHNKEVFAYFMEMGTGKTKVVIDTMAILYEAEKLKAVLIIAPKGVYDNWVKGEIPIHLPTRIPRQICRWIPSKTKKFEEELTDFIVSKEPFLKIFVMNVEAFSTSRGSLITRMDSDDIMAPEKLGNKDGNLPLLQVISR